MRRRVGCTVSRDAAFHEDPTEVRPADVRVTEGHEYGDLEHFEAPAGGEVLQAAACKRQHQEECCRHPAGTLPAGNDGLRGDTDDP